MIIKKGDNLIMSKYLTKNKIDNLDIDAFYGSLFSKIAEIPAVCGRIDEQVERLALAQNLLYTSTMEQYETIIELASVKKELKKLRLLFKQWYGYLTIKQKWLYVTYYVDRNKELCGQKLNITVTSVERRIAKLKQRFIKFARKFSNVDEMAMLRYPYAHNLYAFECDRKNKKELKKNEKECTEV